MRTAERRSRRPRKARGGEEPQPDRRLSLLDRALASKGSPLEPAVREEMEARFRHDLGDVRIHTDERAQAAAEALDAEALAVGERIVFARGRYAPETVEGRMLLAHEIAHVLRGDTESTEAAEDRPEGPQARPSPDPTSGSELGRRQSAAQGRALPVVPAVLDPGAEAGAREIAGRALAGRAIDPTADARAARAHRGGIARFRRGQSLRESISSIADPFVETIATDVARSLEADPEAASARVRRRVARLDAATRAAVVSRVQELLSHEQRERAAEALTAAALGRPEEERDEARREDEPEERGAESERREVVERAEAEQSSRAEAERREEESNEEVERLREHDRRSQAAVRKAAEKAEPETFPAAPAEGEAATDAPEVEGAGADAVLEAPGEAAEVEAPESAASEGAGPLEEPTTGVGAAAAEVAARPGAGDPGAAGAVPAPDLGPITELERRVDDQGRREEKAAREQEMAAAAVEGAAIPAAQAPPEHAADAGAIPTSPEPEAEPEPEPPAGGPAPEPAADEEQIRDDTGPGALAPAPEEPGEVEAPDAASELLPDEPAAAIEPPPTAEELDLAESPEPAPPPDPAIEPAASAELELGAEVAAGPAAEPGGLGGAAIEPDLAEPGLEPASDLGPEEAEPETLGGEEPVPAGEGDPGAEVAAGAAGGDCGPDVGGGGGGSPIEAEPPPPAPDVATAEPAVAMGAVASLPPVEMGRALGGVGEASSRQVGEGRDELAANPPSVERPAGSPETRPAGAVEATRSAAAPAPAAAPGVEPVPSGTPTPTVAPDPLPSPPPAPTNAVSPPPVSGGVEREMTAADAQVLRSSLDRLPVSDPALEVTAGPPPTLSLAGDADPARAREQRERLDASTLAAQEEGIRDVAAPQGERDVYPTVDPETLSAEIATSGGADGAGTMPAVDADEATAVVAREEHAQEARDAAAQAQAQMVADRERHDADVARGREESSAEVDELVRENATEQEARRSEAQAEVRTQRAEWRQAQDGAVRDARVEADAEGERARTEVEAERSRGEREAASHIETGNREAGEHRRTAERDARTERERGRRESSGVLGWLADRARSFFDGIKRGIQRVFEAARTLVRRAIEGAQRLAAAAIETARRAVVAVISAVGSALIAIGDRLLAAFPELRDRFRAAVQGIVDRALEAVNRLAEALKEGVTALLNALGSALEGLLNLLERAYLAAIDLVASAVQGIINAARSVVQALAAFAQLIADVAANPGRWLRNLGASIVDGIRNHLWNAIKCAVKGWFNSKIEEILGMARLIWNLLRRGGIRLAEIGRMVWEAIIASLPMIVIQLAIEKLVSLLVPAAAAVMLIIDGLRAAWGAISRIIAAFEAFFRFLKAVKLGNAGHQFATAVAAGAVALIDFLANFLLLRLRGPAQGVAGRLRALAQRIGGRLRRVGQAVARGTRRAAGAVRRGGARALGAIRTGARTAVGAGRAVIRGAARAATRLGRRLARMPGVGAAWRAARQAWLRARGAWRRARARVQAWRQRRRERAERRRRQRRRRADERLQRAVTELRPQIGALLARGIGRLALGARLLAWRVRYRLRRLWVQGRGTQHAVVRAQANPTGDVTQGYIPPPRVLRRVISQVVDQLRRDPAVAAAAAEIAAAQREGRPVSLTGGAHFLATTRPEVLARGGALPGTRRETRHLVGGQTVSERETVGIPGLAEVRFGRGGGTYPAIARRLGIGADAAIAREIQAAVARGAPLSSGLHARLAYLMFSRESTRNPTNIAHAVFTLQEIERRGGRTFATAFSAFESQSGRAERGGGGEYPMSRARRRVTDFVRLVRARFRRLYGRARTGRPPAPSRAPTSEAHLHLQRGRETARREREQAIRWLLAEAREDRVMFRHERDVERYIRFKLRQFYGLDPAVGGGRRLSPGALAGVGS